MALSVNREIGITPQGNIFAPKPSDIVKSDELTKLAREILTSAPGRKQASVTDVKIFSQGADVNTVKQAATNRTGFNLVLSQDARQAISGLKAQAALSRAQNLAKTVDGRIHINAEKTDFSNIKPAFSGSIEQNILVSESSATDKDRKGPGGFYIPLMEEEEIEGEKEGINLVI